MTLLARLRSGLLPMLTSSILSASTARAQEAPPAAPPAPPAGPSIKLDGYVEVAYSHNFNEPGNGITNFRGFDNRHDTFMLSNVVLGGTFDYESLSGRIALQVGQTPSTYYLGEPALPGTGSTPTSGADLWKYIQQAYVGWNAPVGRGLLLQAGIFLSPVGYEGVAVKDNWNWSRSNLFFGLPFYHTGLKAAYPITDRLTSMVMFSNGWNSVTDSNDWKSITAQMIYAIPDRVTVSFLYFGGPERPRGSPEGQPWRHLFDVWGQISATPWLSFAGQADAGFEQTTFGTSSWGAGALYARVQPVKWLYLAGGEMPSGSTPDPMQRARQRASSGRPTWWPPAPSLPTSARTPTCRFAWSTGTITPTP